MRHMLVAQLLPLILAAMVQNDIDGGQPPLELIHPVGQGGQRPHHHEGPIDLLPPQVTQEANGLHLHPDHTSANNLECPGQPLQAGSCTNTISWSNGHAYCNSNVDVLFWGNLPVHKTPSRSSKQ